MYRLLIYLSSLAILMACNNNSLQKNAGVSNNDSLPSVKNNKKELYDSLEKITKAHKATIGIAIIDLESRDTFLINNDHHYPMQSVYKFPLAMAVLLQVDKGKFTLDQKIHISKKDLLPETWSPLREKYPKGNINMTIAELLQYSVSHSDNNACDILFKMIGGPLKADSIIHGLGIKDIAIVATENEMHAEWNIQYTNYSTPLAMAGILDILYRKEHLSDSSNRFLMRLMKETSTGPLRLKGLLPEGTIVAHKTGTSNTNENGLTAATNDVGIITLPNGKNFIISVFVSDTKEPVENNEKIIAEIAKAAYDYFTEMR